MLFILVIRSIVVTIVIAILRPEHSNGTCWQLLSWLICSEISAYDRVLLLRYVLSRAVRGVGLGYLPAATFFSLTLR